MTSIIENFRANGFNYTVTARTMCSSSCEPYKALNNDGNFYHSEYTTNEWWQISFEKAVLIKSYTIGAPSGWTYKLKEWEISASLSGKKLKKIRKDSTESMIGKVEKFSFINPIRCNNFRITHVSSTENFLAFAYFDCFGNIRAIKDPEKNRSYFNLMAFLITRIYTFIVSQ